jgi:hypothetical protein
MTPSVPVAPARPRTRLRNTLAVAILGGAAAVLYFQFDPVPSGPASGDTAADVATLTAELDESLVSAQPVSLEAVPGSEGQPPGKLPPTSAIPLEGRAALEHDLERLCRARDRLLHVSDYTATFCRRERTGRNLGDADVMRLKVRHEPFGFYMKWLNGDVGREILYVEGQNEGEMLVKLGGLRGRLLPALNINPNGAVAMRECRHPATEMGLLHLAQRMIRYRQRDVGQPGGIRCEVSPNCEFQNRLCDCVVIEYDRAELSPDYRKTMHYFDPELGLPVLVKSWGWSAALADVDPANLDETTLVEQYAYTDIRLNARLSARDFERDNPQYAFSR